MQMVAAIYGHPACTVKCHAVIANAIKHSEANVVSISISVEEYTGHAYERIVVLIR